MGPGVTPSPRVPMAGMKVEATGPEGFHGQPTVGMLSRAFTPDAHTLARVTHRRRTPRSNLPGARSKAPEMKATGQLNSFTSSKKSGFSGRRGLFCFLCQRHWHVRGSAPSGNPANPGHLDNLMNRLALPRVYPNWLRSYQKWIEAGIGSVDKMGEADWMGGHTGPKGAASPFACQPRDWVNWLRSFIFGPEMASFVKKQGVKAERKGRS